jgi:hypothetical protein
MKSRLTPFDISAVARPNAYGLSTPPVSNPTSISTGGVDAFAEPPLSSLVLFANEVAVTTQITSIVFFYPGFLRGVLLLTKLA